MAADVVAGAADLRGSPKERALAGFAALMTEAPWTLDAGDMARLRAVGLSEDAIEHAITVAACFNYYPRVADAVGIDFDYQSPLDRMTIEKDREAMPRPPREEWNPAVDGSSLPVFQSRPFARAPYKAWRAYLFEGDEPLSRRDRLVLAKATAEELCDAGAVESWKEAAPRNDRERELSIYAKKLTRTPWAMTAEDLEPLRSHGLAEEALLLMIGLVAHQNTISRMHFGLVAARG